MKTVDLFFGGLLTLVRWLCLGLVFGMTVIVVFTVFFRYVLNDPIVWSDEIIMLMLLSLTYLGAALGASQRAHIHVEVLETLVKKKGEELLKRLLLALDLITVSVLGIIAFYAFKIARFSQDQKTDILMISYFWVYIILCIGTAFMILMIFKRIREDRLLG